MVESPLQSSAYPYRPLATSNLSKLWIRNLDLRKT
jgi:hypothetical protein